MATENKDFRVKNGLFVNQGGYFGGTVTVASPIANSDAATKEYVDTLVSAPAVPVDDIAPESPSNGDLWLDTVTERVHVYYNGSWIAIATLEDAETLQDHIHDTAIDGTGQIVSVFVDAGYYNDPGVMVGAGFYNTTSWDQTWSGGIAIDNFN